MIAPHVQEGLAHMCLVGSSTTVQKAKIESSIPRKRGAAAAGYDKALQSFFNKVSSILRSTQYANRHKQRSACLCCVDRRQGTHSSLS